MNLDKKTYFNYLSIKYNMFRPLTKFMNYDEVDKVCENYLLKKKFFPVPVFLSANRSDLSSIENGEIKIFFRDKFVEKLKIISISSYQTLAKLKKLVKKNYILKIKKTL